MKKAIEVMFVLVMVSLLALGTVNVAQAAFGQTWYLSGEQDESYLMYRGDPTQDGNYIVWDDDSSQVWYSDETASTDVTFPAGLWNGNIEIGETDDFTIRVEVGSYNGTTFFVSGGSDYADIDGEETGVFQIDASQFTVPNGDWLAVRTSDPSDEADDLPEINTGDDYSYITSPSSDPGYPVPELSTIILLSVGLVGLGGYIWYTWHRRNRKTAIGETS
ncbi:hypothetical protein ACFLUU_03560 [Chloroflexota bacterium]